MRGNIPRDDRAKMNRALFAALKPGGALAIAAATATP
jgi:predicted methyltransferase